eukprot:17024-Heterococcus_DN1.PRE.2
MNSSDMESARQLYQLSKVGSSSSSSSSATTVSAVAAGASSVTCTGVTAVTQGHCPTAAASTTQQDAAILLGCKSDAPTSDSPVACTNVTSTAATALLPGFEFTPAAATAAATSAAGTDSLTTSATAPSMLLQCSRAYTAPATSAATAAAAAAAVPPCSINNGSSSSCGSNSSANACTGMCPLLDSVLPVQHSFIAADVAELLCAGSDTAAFGPSMVSELLIGDNSSSNNSSNCSHNSAQQYRICDSGSSDCFSGEQLHRSELAGVHANSSSSSDKQTAADLQWEYVNGDSSGTAAAGDKRKRDKAAGTAA